MAFNQYKTRKSNGQPRRSTVTTVNDLQNISPISSNDRSVSLNSDRTRIGMTVCDFNQFRPITSTPQYQLNNTLEASIRTIAEEYDIQPIMAQRLRTLQDFEIVIVCDDSGSMKTPVDGTQRTRWNELCDIVKIVLRIGVIFDSNGVDIYFLNRGKFLRVKDPTTVEQLFDPPPSGYTPLVPVLREIFQSPLAERGRDKKLLVFIATDGAPTDENGNENVRELEHLIRDIRRVDTTHISFLLCTDDPFCMNYLNEWDRNMINLDVTDDFHTERNQVRQFHGATYPFSIGDYVVKTLIGAVDPEIDAINEPSISSDSQA